MGTPTEVIKSAYAAFGRRDIPAILDLLTNDVDWRFIAGPGAGVPYAGRFSGKEAVQRWFGLLAQSDEILAFEPREFLEGPNHVTVIGWERGKPLPSGTEFESDWVHVFTLKGDKVSRWIGTADTAARVVAVK